MTTPALPQRASWMGLLLATLWIVPVLGGPGWSWMGFGIAALIAADPRLWWPAIAYTTVGFITLPLEDELSLDDLATIIRTLAWVACIVHGLVVLPRVLRRVAEGNGAIRTEQERRRSADRARRERAGTPGGARTTSTAGGARSGGGRRRGAPARPAPVPEEARELAAAGERARDALVDRSAAAPAVPTVDVNKASRRDLAKLPGMDRERARTVVAERDRRGGFATLEDFARTAGLQPHEAVRLRAHAFCSPRPRPPRTFARRVDL